MADRKMGDRKIKIFRTSSLLFFCLPFFCPPFFCLPFFCPPFFCPICLLLNQTSWNCRSHPIDIRRRESRVEQLLREPGEAFGDRRIGLLSQIG
jgi:hypothetical protein